MRRSIVLAVLALLAGCTRPPDPGFNDHTRPTLPTVADFTALAAEAHGREEVKFVITSFHDDAARSLRWMASDFYTLHDEWYWFRLLNGEPIPGDSVAPWFGRSFDSIASIYDWARTQPGLPLDLRWVDAGRVYSPRFYELALRRLTRSLGVGTVLHIAPTASRQERWVLMLEIPDEPTPEELDRFFTAVEPTLPPESQGQLKWLVRSPFQEVLAQTMEREGLPRHDRILRAKDLAVPGEIEVYTPGLTAGRLRFVQEKEPIPEDASQQDILVLAQVPDFLPSAAALITVVPQTPLSHLNVLARNRGTPNAYWGGALESLELFELADQRVPVLLHATADGKLRIKVITEQQLYEYQLLLGQTPVAVQPIDVATLPYTYDLRTVTLADVENLRPIIGGKAAGFVALLQGGAGATPDAPLALSVRAYAEHTAALRPRIAQLLSIADFTGSSRTRMLALEGVSAFNERFTTEADRRYRDQLLAAHGPGSVLGDFARAGGVMGEIRNKPIDPATLTTLTAALNAQFADIGVSQGIRFRSSSNVEDIEGFNGAGLYDSNTGFLDAAAQPTPSDRAKTVESAIKRTWASYWAFEAFEERRLEQVDHLSGHMGVVVHPRFDDDKEKSNGVFLFTLLPPGGTEEAVMELNVQLGAESVTNPRGTALPEVDQVRLAAGAGAPTIVRVRKSTLSALPLLSDEQLTELFARAHSVSKAWLARSNVGVAPEKAGRTLTLDFEFRRVHAGWPAMKSGEVRPERTVLKQARSLEPSARRLTPDQQALPFPRDLLVRLSRLTRIRCQSSHFSAEVLQATSDPLLPPDLGHALTPFTGQATVTFTRDVPELPRTTGEVLTLNHLSLTPQPPTQTGGGWAFAALTTGPLKELRLAQGGVFLLRSESGSWAGSDLTCTSEDLFRSAREYLESLL